MAITEITSLDNPLLAPFCRLTDSHLERVEGLFVAESPKVIHSALDAGYSPVALLSERKHILGDAAAVIERCPADMPVFTGERELLAQITGYTLTRGVLCAMQRRPLPSAAEVCRNAKRVAVIDGVSDTTNIGAIFRSAAALGIDAVLLTSTACDPLNRRSIRVSMGTVFLVPWTRINNPVADLKVLGFTTVALALTDDSVSIDDEHLNAQPRLAMILGTEGDGLARDVILQADIVARIPMYHGVDSLNVGAAAAVAFWQLRPHNPQTPNPT